MQREIYQYSRPVRANEGLDKNHIPLRGNSYQREFSYGFESSYKSQYSLSPGKQNNELVKSPFNNLLNSSHNQTSYEAPSVRLRNGNSAKHYYRPNVCAVSHQLFNDNLGNKCNILRPMSVQKRSYSYRKAIEPKKLVTNSSANSLTNRSKKLKNLLTYEGILPSSKYKTSELNNIFDRSTLVSSSHKYNSLFDRRKSHFVKDSYQEMNIRSQNVDMESYRHSHKTLNRIRLPYQEIDSDWKKASKLRNLINNDTIQTSIAQKEHFDKAKETRTNYHYHLKESPENIEIKRADSPQLFNYYNQRIAKKLAIYEKDSGLKYQPDVTNYENLQKLKISSREELLSKCKKNNNFLHLLGSKNRIKNKKQNYGSELTIENNSQKCVENMKSSSHLESKEDHDTNIEKLKSTVSNNHNKQMQEKFSSKIDIKEFKLDEEEIKLEKAKEENNQVKMKEKKLGLNSSKKLAEEKKIKLILQKEPRMPTKKAEIKDEEMTDQKKAEIKDKEITVQMKPKKNNEELFDLPKIKTDEIAEKNEIENQIEKVFVSTSPNLDEVKEIEPIKKKESDKTNDKSYNFVIKGSNTDSIAKKRFILSRGGSKESYYSKSSAGLINYNLAERSLAATPVFGDLPFKSSLAEEKKYNQEKISSINEVTPKILSVPNEKKNCFYSFKNIEESDGTQNLEAENESQDFWLSKKNSEKEIQIKSEPSLFDESIDLKPFENSENNESPKEDADSELNEALIVDSQVAEKKGNIPQTFSPNHISCLSENIGYKPEKNKYKKISVTQQEIETKQETMLGSESDFRSKSGSVSQITNSPLTIRKFTSRVIEQQFPKNLGPADLDFDSCELDDDIRLLTQTRPKNAGN